MKRAKKWEVLDGPGRIILVEDEDQKKPVEEIIEEDLRATIKRLQAQIRARQRKGWRLSAIVFLEGFHAHMEK